MTQGPSDLALLRLSRRVGRALAAREWRVATAESCTAGWVAKVLTDVPGSSHWVEAGYIVYSNAAKLRDLKVPPGTLRRHGAVSRATVLAMARGAVLASGADLAVAISGIAGPDGGTREKPVGTVWFSITVRPRAARGSATLKVFSGDREAVRRKAVAFALQLILQQAST
ncbi:MAG TPA: nicotinamide-nucleotide amidohydrolase family protein [Steroidobacteraceae bacterium]|jgi:nicotinamide-nucleotide amidase|nr:nicotinamide-nucleotide amidohydrolase family protein [Steroidobacteraceae bacterium]